MKRFFACLAFFMAFAIGSEALAAPYGGIRMRRGIAISNENFCKGTLTGHGGITVPARPGKYILKTAGSNLFGLDSQSRLVPVGTTYGTAQPLAAATGPYQLTFTEYNDAGYTTPSGRLLNMRVTMEDNCYDVAPNPTAATMPTGGAMTLDQIGSTSTYNQIQRVILAGGVKFGDHIKLRSGDYLTGVNLLRTAGGQFTVGTQGYTAPTDETSPGWVVVEARERRKAHLFGLAIDAKNLAAQNLSFERIEISAYNTNQSTASAYAAVVVSSTSGTRDYSYLRFVDNDIHSRIEPGNCTRANDWTGVVGNNCLTGIGTSWKYLKPGTPNTYSSVHSNVFSGILLGSATNVPDHIYILDNEIRDTYDGINFTGTTALKIVGNTLHDNWNDAIKGYGNNIKINWNFVYDKKYGDGGLHGDFIQQDYSALCDNGKPANNNACPQYNINDVEYIGNRLIGGLCRPDNCNDGQGIFLKGGPINLTVTNVKIQGNFVMHSLANALVCQRCVNALVDHNTFTSSPAGVRNSNISQVSTNLQTNTTFRYNMGQIIGSATGNVSRTSTSECVTYGAQDYRCFGSQFQGTFGPTTVRDDPTHDWSVLSARYRYKTGGPGDGTIKAGAIGPYVNYETRTYSPPTYP